MIARDAPRGSRFWAKAVAERISVVTAALLFVITNVADLPRDEYLRALSVIGALVLLGLVIFRGALRSVREVPGARWAAVIAAVGLAGVLYGTLLPYVPSAYLLFIPFIMVAGLMGPLQLSLATAAASFGAYLAISELLGRSPSALAVIVGSGTFLLTGFVSGVLSQELRSHYTKEQEEHRRAVAIGHRLSAVLEAVEEAIVYSDSKNVIQMVNARAVELFDLEPSSFVGGPAIELARHVARLTEDPEGYVETLQQIRDDPDMELKTQIEQIIPERRILTLLSRPVRDGSGSRVGRVEVFVDISEGVRRAEQVERLLQEARSTAESYQRALLPQSVPSLPRVGVVAHYIPAAGRRAVCGDFYDFLTLPDGRVCVVLGDPCGVGPQAVSDAALARYTLASLARGETNPSRLLSLANAHVGDRLGVDRFIRLALVVLDPERATVTYASAGHVPPMLFRPSSGRVETLEAAGLPLGVAKDTRFEPGETALDPGDMLFLYTDGVTEASRRGRPYGQGRLTDLVRDFGVGTPGELVQAARRSVEAWMDGELHDDLAMVACQVVPDATVGELQRELVLPNEPARIREVRDFVGGFLTDVRAPVEVASEILLAVSEAAGNSVRYGRRGEGRSEIRARCRLEGTDVVVSVSDDGPGFDERRLTSAELPDPFASGGRGLFLMRRLMDEISIDSSPQGTTVHLKRRAFDQAPITGGPGEAR